MSPSLQMQECVDKQKESEDALIHMMRRSLPRSFFEADEYLAILLAGSIRQDVRNIGLIAQLHIELLGTRRSDEDKGYIPPRENRCSNG